jgi:D-glycero-alpha-D-manno-heptose-7-phosphate kinase
MKMNQGVEIHHDGDLPARTGLGSSSSFTVGLLNCLYALKGQMVSHEQLAQDAITVEQEWIRENVGCQDQIAAACGGFNLIEFNRDEEFKMYPLTLRQDRLKELQSHLMLVFTGLSRIASEIAEKLVKTANQKKKELKTMHQMVYEAVKILNGKSDIKDFGKLLHESWKIKRSLTDKITTPEIDRIYEMALKSGALGGKLLGAGGGGFLLLFVPPQAQKKIKASLNHFLYVPFQFENSGSQIIYYNNRMQAS